MEENTAKEILVQLKRIADALEHANSTNEAQNRRLIKKDLLEKRNKRDK